MNAAIEIIGNVSVVEILDSYLDATNAGIFKQEVGNLLETSSRVIIDLKRVDMLDSAGCGAILTCLGRAGRVGCSLVVCGMTQRVRDIFALVRMDRILDLFDSRMDALHRNRLTSLELQPMAV